MLPAELPNVARQPTGAVASPTEATMIRPPALPPRGPRFVRTRQRRRRRANAQLCFASRAIVLLCVAPYEVTRAGGSG